MKNEICFEKSLLKLFFVLIIGVIVGGVFVSYINKNPLKPKASYQVPLCKYRNLQKCQLTYDTGVCEENSCRLCTDGSYKCTPQDRFDAGFSAEPPSPNPEECVEYGTEFYMTSDNKCWSIKSKPISENFLVQRCGQEIAKISDKSKCPPKDYCDIDNKSESYKIIGGGTRLSEKYYYRPWKNSNGSIGGCYSWGIETGLTEREPFRNINSEFPSCSFKQVNDTQCDIDKYICSQNRYALINNECWHLGYKKCKQVFVGNNLTIPACCSDKVNISYCTGGRR